jgi:hypothetical protein
VLCEKTFFVLKNGVFIKKFLFILIISFYAHSSDNYGYSCRVSDGCYEDNVCEELYGCYEGNVCHEQYGCYEESSKYYNLISEKEDDDFDTFSSDYYTPYVYSPDYFLNREIQKLNDCLLYKICF